MKLKFEISELASKDLDNIWQYTGFDSPDQLFLQTVCTTHCCVVHLPFKAHTMSLMNRFR